MITLDYLPRTNIQLYQDDEMIRINTDTEVLGEFLEVYRNDTVLDMGTNQGALLLYASKFTPKKLIGLEINERGCELAKKNMELNNITNYEIINGDIITYTSTPVDVIICNPPYFKTDEHNKDDNNKFGDETKLFITNYLIACMGLKKYDDAYDTIIKYEYINSNVICCLTILNYINSKYEINKFLNDKNKYLYNVVKEILETKTNKKIEEINDYSVSKSLIKIIDNLI